MEKITLALDWTPNINHIGFFVAQEKGYYRSNGVEAELLDPATDQYRTTPAKKVETGHADCALCPTESIISYRTKAKPFNLIAIAALLQSDLSAIVVHANSGIESPKDLDGKVYASYQARYEDEIVKQMIRNAGGTGEIAVEYPAKLGIWETILNGSFDATWIFLNWEALQGEVLGQPLRYFRLEDYNIPYSYSPVIAASQEAIREKPGAYRSFLAAAKQGYLYAAENPRESAEILHNYVPEHDKNIDLVKAIEVSAEQFGNGDTWGTMDPVTVQRFLQWIYANGLEKQTLTVDQVITHECLVTRSGYSSRTGC